MKKETYLKKLNEMLGITEVAEKVVQKDKEKRTGRIQGVSEDEIQEFRALQGVLYYLQAPELFTARTCAHCGEPFLVSRRLVAYCQWSCMRKGIQSHGYEWRKGEGIEFDEDKMLDLIRDKQVFNGQEPIWVRNLPTLKVALEKLIKFVESEQTQSLDQETPTSSSSPEKSPNFSSLLSTIGYGQASAK